MIRTFAFIIFSTLAAITILPLPASARDPHSAFLEVSLTHDTGRWFIRPGDLNGLACPGKWKPYTYIGGNRESVCYLPYGWMPQNPPGKLWHIHFNGERFTAYLLPDDGGVQYEK